MGLRAALNTKRMLNEDIDISREHIAQEVAGLLVDKLRLFFESPVFYAFWTENRRRAANAISDEEVKRFTNVELAQLDLSESFKDVMGDDE